MRTNDVGKLFLRWLVDTHDGEARDPREFLASGPTLNGEPIADVHLGRVLDRIEDLDLGRTLKTFGDTIPMDVKLNSRGWQCVEEHDCDMIEFENPLRGTTGTTTTVTVNARDGVNVVGTGRDVAQSNRIEITNDPERLRLAADAIDEILPLYPGLRDRVEVEGAVESARVAADSGDEDARASAGARLVTAITTLAGVSTVGRVVVEMLTASGVLG